MLTNEQIIRTLREIAILVKHDFDLNDLHTVEINQRRYSEDSFPEFRRDLIEAGNKIRIMLLENQLGKESVGDSFENQKSPILVFIKKKNLIVPTIVVKRKRNFFEILQINEAATTTEFVSLSQLLELTFEENGEIHFYPIFPYQSPINQAEHGEHLTPSKRLFNLLGTERKEIIYILFYAIITGLASLILPLGIQATVELISGGVVFSSVYVMIGVVIFGIILTGVLQIVQLSLVEYLQRRIFTKAALEFAYRIPRIKLESIMNNYAPELVNRFFDVMTIQKGLPKLLIDLSSAAIQIVFGLLLISLYHPFFVFFGLVLLVVLVLIFYYTGGKGLSSSIKESKYKYNVAHWLEELARAMQSFKMAGNSELPIRKLDYSVNNYLKNRKIHFSVLINQFSFIVLFKAAITGGLLIMGTSLVIQRQITLGQLVASEIVIILILNSVEKIIMYMDVVYDLLTAVDKVGHVTDIAIERSGGIDLKESDHVGFHVRLKNVSYKYANGSLALNKLSLEVERGKSICISGAGNSGRTTLANILTGFYTQFEGIVTYDSYSLRDLDLTALRDRIAKNISTQDIFDGTLLDNLSVGKPGVAIHEVIEAIEKVGLSDFINSMPQGLDSPIISGGKGMSNSTIQKLILARCLIKKPDLMILNDFFIGLTKSNKLSLMKCVFEDSRPWTIIAISNDPLVMSACDKVVILENGSVSTEGTFESLLKKGALSEIID
jgi:ABC-type bacteriocin/lantibiotic exporter with double-glycine peptidase domain